MKNFHPYFDMIISLCISIAIASVIIPIIIQIAKKVGLMDKPNARKVHSSNIPVIGGLAIGVSLMLSLFFNPNLTIGSTANLTIIFSAMILMIVGCLDDKLDLKASHRLVLQIVCAYAIAATGTRLTSLYGIFGIDTLDLYVSYAITILLITGVVNAFNLIDGIDGLAGLLAILSLSIFGYQAFILGESNLLMILVTLIGSVFVFLRYNLGKNKIFLGDGGSLLLGFIMVSIGIQLIEFSNLSSSANVSNTISIVFGVFLIPVLDSLRVYWSRMQDGFSPFRADKRHIHHLFLFLKLTHKQASVFIALSAITLSILLILLYSFYGLSTAIVLVSVIFLALTGLLATIKRLDDWKSKISELEYRD